MQLAGNPPSLGSRQQLSVASIPTVSVVPGRLRDGWKLWLPMFSLVAFIGMDHFTTW